MLTSEERATFYTRDVEKLDEKLKGLERLEVSMLYHAGYYDGPLSGMCRYKGEDCWFDLLHETDPHPCPKSKECDERAREALDIEEGRFTILDVTAQEWDCPPDSELEGNCQKVLSRRFFGVYRVDKATLKEEARRHALFQKYVGTHTDYDPKYKEPRHARVKRQKNWHKYYDTAEKWPKLNLKQELIGYFVW